MKSTRAVILKQRASLTLGRRAVLPLTHCFAVQSLRPWLRCADFSRACSRVSASVSLGQGASRAVSLTITSWLYVSRSLLTGSEAEAAVRNIVEVASRKNEAHGLTGALIFNGTEFAQYLEGPAEPLQEIRAAIHKDDRHTDIKTLEEAQRTARTFPDWSLAYSGPSSLVRASLAGFLRPPPPTSCLAIPRLS